MTTKFIANKFDYEGYLFLGWATVSNIVPKSPKEKVDYVDGYDEFLFEVAEDDKIINLYGVWFNLNTKYDVGFNMHGHGIQIATMSVAYDSLLDGLASPSEPGYSFDGWYRDAGYSSLWNLDSDKVTDHIVLHAKWTVVTYTITLNTNGGEYADNYSVPVSRTYFDAVTLPTSSNIKKQGYTFVGWYENSDFSGNVITDIPANTEGNKVYYLKWSENEYTITLNNNGGTYANGYREPKSRKYSEAVTLPTSENITKTGNIFIGWYDNDSFTGTKVLNIASNSEGNKVFYLKWQPVKYTIRYNTDGGTISSATVTKNYGENLTLATPSKLGYAFDGWYSDVALTNLYDGKSDLKDTEGGEVNIYAKYRYSKYRVIYTSSDAGVTGGTKAQDCTYDTQYTSIKTSEFTKANWRNQYYRFVKSEPTGHTPTRTRLYSEQEFSNLIGVDGVDLIYEPIFTMISNEDTEPGKSEEEHNEQTKDNETFVVTYYRNIDDADVASVSVVYNYNQMALTERAKTLHLIYEGHKCQGWALESDKTTIKYHELEEIFYEADANPEANNNINLYAVWGENGYNVVFSRSGLSGVTGDNRTYELTFKEKATSPASTNFTKQNSRFAYYEYTSATLENEAYTYTPKRERIYASREFSELATVEDIELMYKPHFTTISNNNTNPGKTDEEHNRQTEENETFVITYFANNDTDAKVEETYRYDTESYTLENTFVKEGHHFMGWTDDPNKTSVLYNEKEEIFFKIENDDDNNISLYAVWEENTYKVVWTSDGDTDISGDDRTVELKFSQKGTAPVETAFTKADSKFAYYEYFKIEPTESTNYKISRERLYKSQEFSGLVDIHNVTLYFKPVFTTISNETTDPGKTDEEHNEQTKENETFVFTYYANDGTENKKIVTYNYNTMSLTENKIFDRKNYEFLGWNEDKNATSGDDEYQPGKELFKKVENDANNNKELYAIWRTFEYTITFSANGQENVTGADISITSGFDEEKNAPSSTAFARNSDRFAYYEYVSTIVNGEASNVKPKRLRLYANQLYVGLSEVNGAEYLFRAVFTNDGEVDDSDTEEKFKRLHYEIKYHANNGSNNVITQIATYNEATFIQKNDLKRTGYSFKGYSTSQGSSTVAYVDGDEVFVKVEDDRVLNLYAVWKKTGGGGNGGGNSGGGSSGGGGGGGGGGKTPGTLIEKVVPSFWIFNNAINKYVVYGEGWKILTGWVYTSGINNRIGWHYFTPYGTPMSGWFYDMNNEIYYFGNDFVMATGNAEADGIVRKFDVSGALRDNLFTPDNKNVNNRGVWLYEPSVNSWQYWILQENETIALVRSSWFKSNVSGVDAYYAVDKNGTPITGFVKYKGQYFYLQEDGPKFGQLMSDTTIIRNGVSITFDEYGRITNDIRQIENAIKIFDMDANTQTSNFWITNSDATKSYVKSNKYVSGLSNLEKATGVQNIDNYYYSFNPAGQLQFGLQVIDDKLYYAKDYEPREGSLPLQK